LEVAFFLPFVYYARLLPYTKVEESFNMQAIHDISQYGAFPNGGVDGLKAKYDHFEFPGVVPRTFIGAVVVSAFRNALVSVKEIVGGNVASGLAAQIESRQVLGAFNYVFLYVFANRVGKAFSSNVRTWFLVLLVSQFHIVSYASRTLPNMFALGPGKIKLLSRLIGSRLRALRLPSSVSGKPGTRLFQAVSLIFVYPDASSGNLPC
jgi:alpha-1,6-mannosyltransferase